MNEQADVWARYLIANGYMEQGNYQRFISTYQNQGVVSPVPHVQLPEHRNTGKTYQSNKNRHLAVCTEPKRECKHRLVGGFCSVVGSSGTDSHHESGKNQCLLEKGKQYEKCP